MKSRIIQLAVLIAVAVAIIAASTVVYTRFVNSRVFAESSMHLQTIYSQVNEKVAIRINRNFTLLNEFADISKYFIENGDEDYVESYLKRKSRAWVFPEFIFIAEDGTYMSPDGSKGRLSSDIWKDALLDEKRNLTLNGNAFGRPDRMFFAIPAEGTYLGFDYKAFATFSDKEFMRSDMNITQYQGIMRSCIIFNDGTIYFTTENSTEELALNGEVNLPIGESGNYFDFLTKNADFKEGYGKTTLSAIISDMQNGISGTSQFSYNNRMYYMVYQPSNYDNSIFIGIAPVDVINRNLSSIQNGTLGFSGAFAAVLILSLTTVVMGFYRGRLNQKDLELEYRERLFEVLVTNIDTVFVILSTDGKHAEFVSPNIKRILGVPAQDVRINISALTQQRAETTAGDDGAAFSLSDADFKDNKTVETEREYENKKTGERRWFTEVVYKVDIQNEHTYKKESRLLLTMTDRTQAHNDKESIATALSVAETANKAKSSFLSSMSHDIRTPMNAIVGFTVLLANDAENPDKVREYTKKITTASQHLLGLINDVLDMSKIESGKTTLNKEPFNLRELIESMNSIMGPQARAKSQKFSIYVSGVHGEVFVGDKVRIGQILQNLLSNAIKYTPDGGTVSLNVEGLPAALKGHERFKIKVKDNGIGMSAEFCKAIFEPFSREDRAVTLGIRGTGIGMAITKNLVDLMGGTISVESEIDKGTCFTVEIELRNAEKPGYDDKFFENHGITDVLVVDDEEDVGRNTTNLLSDAGVRAVYVLSGEEAVRYVRRAFEDRNPYDIVILDWKMPGIDGVETARRIRAIVGPEITIIVLTSYSWDEIEDEARAAGVDAFLPKPFFVSGLQQIVSELRGSEAKKTEESGTDEKSAAPKESPLKGKRFLAAEDNEINSDLLQDLMEMEGAEIDITPDGKQVSERFISSPPGTYDAILMDVQMPVMNGYEATRAIRKSPHPEAATIPIIAMTADAFTDDMKKALDSGMNEHIAKPIDMARLRDCVNRLCKPGT